MICLTFVSVSVLLFCQVDCSLAAPLRALSEGQAGSVHFDPEVKLLTSDAQRRCARVHQHQELKVESFSLAVFVLIAAKLYPVSKTYLLK